MGLEEFNSFLEGISPEFIIKIKKKIEEEDNTILYDVTYQLLRFPPGSQPPTLD